MKSRKNLWQYTVILFILNIFFITAQTSHNQNIYADFNFSRNDTTHDKWTKSIEIITPRLRTVITDDTKITLRAPGMNRVYAYCWQQPTTGQPNKWGHDVNLTPGGIETKGAEKVSFVFPARDFPYGPTNIRIYASNNEGKKDVFELQLYNKAGKKWNYGIPDTVPSQAKGLKLVFEDDFDNELSISNDGKNARYCAHKPRYGDFSGWPFSDVDGPDNPFEQVDTYLKIKARKRAGTKGSSGLISSVNMDGERFFTKAPCYLECRFTAQSAPGTWPAFWTLTSIDRGINGDELDIVEAYGGVGKGNPNHQAYSITSHFWGQKEPDGTYKKRFNKRVPIMELGGKSYWSTTFHTYGLYVGRDETIYYFDGIEVLRHPTNDISKEKPLFFLINYAIGGISGWPIDLERFGNASDMYVDYVRVFAENDIQYSIPLPEKNKNHKSHQS